MLFSSVIFIFKFLPLALLFYFLVKDSSRNLFFKNIFLLIISLIFYAWGEPIYVLLMILSIVVNYIFGILIEKNSPKPSRWALITGILVNVSLLIYFKYSGFITQNIQAIFHLKLEDTHPVALPIGISFYTFQSLSYLIDIYRKEVKAQTSAINVGLYISFFPQLIAGPIVRYTDINHQIDNRKVEWDGFVLGVQRFIIGLAKKVLLANTLGEVADKIFMLPHNEITTLCSWLGILCYSFQIFFDFSGYSDMAIGLGRMFGFTFLENFNYPYAAKSIRDFWRRWHISLSSWFRDYLYIPLGGNRGTILRTHVNLIIVFFITGLWHGASWNFVIWGLFHGFFLIVERGWFGTWMERQWSPFQHLYAVLVVVVGWVFFRLNTLNEAWSYLKVMAGAGLPGNHPFDFVDFINQKVLLSFIAAIMFSTSWIKWRTYETPNVQTTLWSTIVTVVLLCLFILSIANIASDTYNPFIYFRF